MTKQFNEDCQRIALLVAIKQVEEALEKDFKVCKEFGSLSCGSCRANVLRGELEWYADIINYTGT